MDMKRTPFWSMLKNSPALRRRHRVTIVGLYALLPFVRMPIPQCSTQINSQMKIAAHRDETLGIKTLCFLRRSDFSFEFAQCFGRGTVLVVAMPFCSGQTDVQAVEVYIDAIADVLLFSPFPCSPSPPLSFGWNY